MSDLHHPHDHFVKRVFAQLDTARDFFRHYLPDEVLAELRLDTLSLPKGSFVDPELHPHLSDLLYLVQQQNDEEAYLYLLLEHKSQPDKLTPLQLLRYMVQIWQEDSDNQQPLRPIIPLVLYHGPQPWHLSHNFMGLFNGPSVLKRYWPSFDYQLYDLSQYDDEELRGLAQTRIVLLLLKHIRDRDLIERLPAIFRLLDQLANAENGLEYLQSVLTYIAAAAASVSATELRQVLQRVVDQEGESIMTTLAQQWFEEGKREGREEGWEEGQQDLLLFLMREKFGPLPASWEARLRAVEDPARLTSIAQQLLTAESLADLDL